MHYGCLVRCNGNYEIIVDDTDGVDGFLIKLDVYGTKEETIYTICIINNDFIIAVASH
jgi:hypothetical protein